MLSGGLEVPFSIVNMLIFIKDDSFVSFLLNVPVNNLSVLSGRSHRFLGITSTFLGGKCILLKATKRRSERPR